MKRFLSIAGVFHINSEQKKKVFFVKKRTEENYRKLKEAEIKSAFTKDDFEKLKLMIEGPMDLEKLKMDHESAKFNYEELELKCEELRNELKRTEHICYTAKESMEEKLMIVKGYIPAKTQILSCGFVMTK
jgi:hypothetical protein